MFKPNTYGKYCSIKCRSHAGYRKLRSKPINVVRARTGGYLRQALKRYGIKEYRKKEEILGYTIEDLYRHLESQFTEENGYTWDNMDEWHIDHIRPVSSFDFDSTDHPDFKKCWALNNLQPLWAFDNMSKGDKWDGVVNA